MIKKGLIFFFESWIGLILLGILIIIAALVLMDLAGFWKTPTSSLLDLFSRK